MAAPNWVPEDRIDHRAIQALRTQVRGQVIVPGDANYNDARKVYNGMIDKYPRLIVRCADVADVITAVNFGRDQEVAIAIRGGGHNGAGLSTCDDGLVIDLSNMRGVRVDPSRREARVEGGCTLGDIDHATHPFGLALPGGIISTTGVAGLTLGGGLGHLTRKYGLTIDHLLSADVVLADGSFVTTSADDNADLLWALRGGGGNFGVVTSFLFRLEPAHTVYGGPMLWNLDIAAKAMRFYDDFMKSAPEDLNGFFAFMNVPPGPPFPEHLHNKTMCGVVWCYTGPADKVEAVLRPVREFAPPALDFVGPLPLPALQSMFDPLMPPGLQWYWKADYCGDLTDEAIAANVKHGSQLPTGLSQMHLYPIDGAAHRVSKDETAFSYRDARYGQVIVGVDPDPANNTRMIQWARDYWDAIHPYSSGGGYLNMMMDEGEERVRAAYRDNYPRLASIKKKYDPTNLFHVNQNIKPAD